MYIRTSEGLGQSPYVGRPFDRAKAVKANRFYRSQLGWNKHIDRIKDFVNFVNMGAPEYEEEALAIAIANWQNEYDPNSTVDGIIGPGLWSRMRAAGVLKAKSWWNMHCRTAPVTNGEFGIALKWYTNDNCVPDEVVNLLRSSSTFLWKIVKELDSKYIASVGWDIEFSETPPSDSNFDWQKVWGATADGILTKGTYRGYSVKGRRVLEIKHSFIGSSFVPASFHENPQPIDTILLQPPTKTRVGLKADATELGTWIERIVHESIHALHRVMFTGAHPANLVDRIRKGIAEEIRTRKEEVSIVTEIRTTSLGKKLLKAFVPAPGATDSATVERDFFPSKLRRTYLEHYVLLGLLDEAISLEKLTLEDMDKKNKEVEVIPLDDWRSRRFPSNYSKLRYWLRVIDSRWQKALTIYTPGTPEFGRLKETVLQEHANAFFFTPNGVRIIDYAPLP